MARGSADAVRTSKFLSLVLRHDPAKIDITLDDAGWVDVGALLAAAARHGTNITRGQLDAVVAGSDKQRFALSDDGGRIRANQGHSVAVDLGYAPAIPPAVLYHGTPEAFLPAIRADGLRKMARHHVHLSADSAVTLQAGGRRGRAVLLTIRAADLAAAGSTFYVTPNAVWLVEAVPPAYIRFPDD